MPSGWACERRGVAVPLSVTLAGRTPSTLAADRPPLEAAVSEVSGGARAMAVTSAAPAAGAARRLGMVAWALWVLAMVGHAAMLWLDDLLRQVGRPELTQVLPLLPHYLVGVGAATVGRCWPVGGLATRWAGSC